MARRTLVRILRSGGLAAFTRRYQLDSATLDPTDLARLEELVGAAELDARPSPPRGADRFQYDFEVERNGDIRRTTAYDGSIPPGLEALRDWVLAHPDATA